MLDVVLRHIEMSDDAYVEVRKNKYLLTGVLFRLHELPAARENFLNGVRRLFLPLSYSTDTSKAEDQLVSSILIVLVSGTVKKNDFGIIKTIRCELSSSSWCLHHASLGLDVFAVLSIYLYSLYYMDSDVPENLKESVQVFISEGGMVEEDTIITSWKALFAEAAEEFNVDYHNFLQLIIDNSYNLEYWVNGISTKTVVLEPGYITTWYLTHLFNI